MHLIAIHRCITPPLSQNTSKTRQKGITLVMVLIFMVTLSLVAAVGMRSVMVGERTVANELDRNLAFQVAESAGRDAVARITDGSHATLPQGYYLNPSMYGGNIQFWQTTSSLPEATVCDAPAGQRFKWSIATGTVCTAAARQTFLPAAAPGVTSYPNTAVPRYVIERMPSQFNIDANFTDCWYRITSRATGGTGQADVILQLMFSPPPVASNPGPPRSLGTCN
jgi:type IV pilus assembly protein PilX